jgi:serine protease AprX
VATGAENREEINAAAGIDAVYPNPFAVSTTVEFVLSWEQHVALEVFDIRGARVGVRADRRLGPGTHRLTWSPVAGARGVYLPRITAGENSETRTVVVVR